MDARRAADDGVDAIIPAAEVVATMTTRAHALLTGRPVTGDAAR